MCLRLKKVNLKKNDKLISLLNSLNADYVVKDGFINVVINTNIKFVEPTTYILSDPAIITILEYEITERQAKNFYIKQYKQKYNFKELSVLLKSLFKEN